MFYHFLFIKTSDYHFVIHVFDFISYRICFQYFSNNKYFFCKVWKIAFSKIFEFSADSYPITCFKFRCLKFKTGDRVRISRKFKDFRKGYLPNFTEEVFIIAEVLKTNPVTYKIKDMNNEVIIGSFYEQEMVKYESELYEVEKILKRNKGKLLVKWKGYKTTSWINEKDLTEI